MSDPTFPADWETKHAFMRAKGLVSARWETVLDPVGCKNSEVLRDATCGPAVLPPTEEEKYAAETQPSASPHERERLERQRRREIVARSSGGPVPRPDVP